METVYVFDIDKNGQITFYHEQLEGDPNDQ